MKSTPLSPDAKRLRTIIISFPVLVATSAILYRRAYLGEQQRRIPHDAQDAAAHAGDKIAGEIGSAPWIVHEKKDGSVLPTSG